MSKRSVEAAMDFSFPTPEERRAAMCVCCGSHGGILASNRLTNYRIAQLEKRVDKHNNLVERMAAAEDSIKSAHRRIDDITRRK